MHHTCIFTHDMNTYNAYIHKAWKIQVQTAVNHYVKKEKKEISSPLKIFVWAIASVSVVEKICNERMSQCLGTKSFNKRK